MVNDSDPNEISIEDDEGDDDNDDRPVEAANGKQDSNPEEIAIEDEDEEDVTNNAKEEVSNSNLTPASDENITHFTALDKSLPNRKFLEVRGLVSQLSLLTRRFSL